MISVFDFDLALGLSCEIILGSTIVLLAASFCNDVAGC
jgi:hypothetical protein